MSTDHDPLLLTACERILTLDREATAGPWETDGSYDLYVYKVPRGNGMAIADRHEDDEAPEGMVARARGTGAGLRGKEQAANMRLIAAYRSDAVRTAKGLQRLLQDSTSPARLLLVQEMLELLRDAHAGFTRLRLIDTEAYGKVKQLAERIDAGAARLEALLTPTEPDRG